MNGKEIRTALHKGQLVYSTAILSTSPLWPKFVRRTGVDFVFIDTEHVPIGRETLSWMCQTFAAMGIPPVVRIPSPDPFEASKVLDGGAGGVIAPYIESAEQIRQLIGVARYRPLKGRRLQEALDDPNSLEPELREYLEKRNEHTILIANIESVPAIENLDAIVSQKGLDSVLIGPHDLSCNLGMPEQYRQPIFDEAVRTIFRKAREHHVGAGIHFWMGIDQEIAWANAGGNLIMHNSDVMLFEQQIKREFEEIRHALGDERKTFAPSAPPVV
ncbi:MAG: aldolase/citrate lyase family protein [Planctomycetota bacterium]|nr:aldolase/citrate lyase family protein [Planctomycetota bacterium]